MSIKTDSLTRESVADRLAGHTDLLQEGFRKLSRAATLKDLSDHFVSVVSGVFPASTIDLLHRSGQSESWQRLSDSGTNRIEEFLKPLPEGNGATTISVVQKLVDKSLVGIVLRQKIAGSDYSDIDLISLRLFVHLFDTAYQELLYRRNEKDLIFSLNHRLLQLNSLIDTGIEVSRLEEETRPHQLALERAASLTNASRGVVRVRSGDRDNEEYVFPPGTTHHKADSDGSQLSTEFTFGDKTYTFELFEKESRSGIIPFEETDQVLLDALARQVHASLENRYLHRQALEKQRIEQEVAVAALIQQRILPAVLPAIPGYDIAGINIPSKSVGGDYYDCIPLTGGKYALIIADVAGKGIPAALLVSSLHAYLSAYLESSVTLLELARRLNRVINHASTDDKFITAFLAILTPESGEIETLNAGHTTTYLIRKDMQIQELSVGGVPFGMLDMEFPFQSERATMNPGDRLFLYTDGITEATNEESQLYDSHVPLKEFLLAQRTENAGEFIRDLISDIKKFTGNAPQNDDITGLYLLRR